MGECVLNAQEVNRTYGCGTLEAIVLGSRVEWRVFRTFEERLGMIRGLSDAYR